jgi:hypothetical protein
MDFLKNTYDIYSSSVCSKDVFHSSEDEYADCLRASIVIHGGLLIAIMIIIVIILIYFGGVNQENVKVTLIMVGMLTLGTILSIIMVKSYARKHYRSVQNELNNFMRINNIDNKESAILLYNRIKALELQRNNAIFQQHTQQSNIQQHTQQTQQKQYPNTGKLRPKNKVFGE